MNFPRAEPMFYDNQLANQQGAQRMHSGSYYPLDDQSQRYDVPRYNDRIASNAMHGGYNGYDVGAQTWNGAQGYSASNTMGGTNRMKQSSRGRAALPPAWLDQGHAQNASPFLGLGGQNGGSPIKTDSLGMDDDDLIPTAIVIKNIPFAVKKEQLVAIMTDLGLPLPYAFNYHFDNGIFRGLAFANFTSADETATVIDLLNHYDLQGRKLRVEYKKMLPAAERERIEREKRERRGQLEEQHRPLGLTTNLQSQVSMPSMANMPGNSPSPVSARGLGSAIDMNDPETLEFYTKLTIFKNGPEDVLQLPPNLTPQQRRIVHTLAHHMQLAHLSKGMGEQRAVHVYKHLDGVSPINGQGDAGRRPIGRAATAEFNDGRNDMYALRTQNQGYPQQFAGQNSAQGQGQAQNGGLTTGGPNLRGAKSFADLRSYTPSPVASTASFPTNLGTNVPRMQDPASRETASATTSHAPANLLGSRDDSMLANGLNNMNLNNGFGNSPRTLRGMVSWDRAANASADNLTTNGTHGAIGGHRSFASNPAEEQSRDRGAASAPRQPRSAADDRTTGFPRSGRPDSGATRLSDELSRPASVADAASTE